MKAEQLRKSILQLAIQGKLVPQDPNDEPASVLLERIRAEKQRLIKEGKIKKDKNDSVIFKGDDNRHYEKVGSEVKDITDDLPFEIPDSWVWVRLGYIVDFAQNDTVTVNKIDSLSWVLDLEDIERDSGTLLRKKTMGETQSKSDKHRFCKGNVLYSKLRPYLNKVIVADDDGYCTTEILTFDFGHYIDARYAQTFLMSPHFVDYAMAGSYGVKMPRIGSQRGNSSLFPLPPYSEQIRIIAEIEKFEPLIAEYDKLEQQATKLDNEIYDKLKKSILQYAIQGKLVPQEPNDEPASVLLERIRAEKKAKLGKKYVDSYIYKGDDNCYYEKVGANEPVRLNNLPFDIPDSWCWARLKDVTFNHGQKIPNATFSYIDIGSIDNVKQKLSAKENIIEPEKAPSRARKIVERGDVLYATVRPYLHNMCIVDKDFSHEPIASTGFAVLAVKRGIKNTFLFYYMLSSIFDQYANSSENSKGVAYPAINDEKLYKALIPIPPQNEQQNICKLIDKCFNVLTLKDEG